MTATKAIKIFFEQEPHGRKLTAKEMLEFKNSIPDAEYQQMGRECCSALGETFDEREPVAA